MTSDERRMRLPAAPAEGWLTLSLVALMAFVMAMAIDDAGWVLQNGDVTNFLWIAALLGVAAGFLGAKVGWNRWVAHALGAVFAALIVPILVGQVLRPGAGLGVQYVATADSAAAAYQDLIVLGLDLTRQIGHHLLILGLLCWGTGQFAASAVFRHRRPLSAVVVMGAILVANMAVIQHDQMFFLIGFSAAALLLLTRLHALDEQATWARRRIGDPSAVGAIYLRGGAVFIIVAVLGSMVLTQTARSKPLEGAWSDLKPWLLDLSAAVQRFLPTPEDGRGIGGVQFGQTATIRGVWTTDGGLALTVSRDPADDSPYYWRAVAFDRFNGLGWEWTGGDDTVRQPVAAGDEILEGSFDRVAPPGTKDVTFHVTPNDLRGSFAVGPLTPLAIDRDAVLLGGGEEAFFHAIEIAEHEPYAITARVPLVGDEGGGLTQNLLRAAGQGYPVEILSRYTQLPDDAVGAEARQVLDDVLRKLETNDIPENPYDLSAALVEELQSRRFVYDPNVTDMQAQCGTLSIAECFALHRRGYCEHFATLMTVLLRERGIPARFVEGFLPGDLDERTGIELVPNSAAHAWVEVYFPGHGWVMFDPTGGGSDLAEADPLPSGLPVASAAPSRFGSINPIPRDEEGPSRDPGGAVVPTRPNGDIGPGGYVLIALVLLVTVLIAAFLIWRQGPRGVVTPEGAWSGIGRLAARFGYGPRPTQTAYEYATALGEVLPSIRPELETVATAKVESAYSRRVLEDDRIRAMRDAYARLRVGLLRLFFRRGQRPKT
ncbi:MAG TPA: transglutaminaseTgpA domain-containing protein [Candidatus Limnocylindrales bacterium]|nr:transglutaminaseTgpA domain-containing protein [Candidatus Limnocylindrales bacterium]